MDPLTLALIGGGAGLLKSELLDRPKEERQRKQAAITARWSPWTGMAPGQIQEADPFGSALQGGLTGAMIGQNIDVTGGGAGQKSMDVAELTAAQPTMQDQLYKTGYYQSPGRMQSSPWQGMRQYALA